MHKQFVEMLACPLCHKELEWHIKKESEDRIINANIICPSCQEEYEIKDEIAVFLTNVLSRNDLWDMGENWLEKYFRDKPEIYEKLMNIPEEELNGADYWYKASYYEINKDFYNSARMFSHAFERIYTQEYIDGWNSQMEFIIENIDSSKPIIDIASGKGYLIEKMLRNTKNYIVATDFSPTILMRNKEYYKALGLYDKLSLIAFDARKTPFKDTSIEILTSNLGLQNIEQPGEVIKEMNRITKKEFMAVMFFIDKEDKVHMDLFDKFGNTAYATKNNAIETFQKSYCNIKMSNSFIANIKPTPVGEVLKGLGIDGFPIQDTKVEFCVLQATK